ncbi:MAG: tRNA (guanine(46)-N(7))-methyltransferase TrmB [Victivallaceae bacterium]
MRPHNLKMPYQWDERKPLLSKGLFSVPNFYFAHSEYRLPDFSHESIFGNDNPVYCEICSGNGDWVIAQALKNPDCNWIAVEKRFDRVRKIFSKYMNCKIANLLVVYGEANTFFSNYLIDQSMEKVFIHFPDPWPKTRHAKHRLITKGFMLEVRRVLKKKGDLIVVTDDEPFLKQSISIIRETLISESESPYYVIIDKEAHGISWFESLWRGKGKAIYRSVFSNGI